ncbi:carbohydrate kinase, partial [Mesorhizobium sp. M00.F.Ca.ET.149.01.1.1]
RNILGAAVGGADIRTSEREEAGAAGAAMIAAVCLGLYPSMDDCVGEWVSPLLGKAEPSDDKLAAIYEAMAPSYAMAHDALRPVWRSMAASKVN